MSADGDVLLVMSSLPDQATARQLAHTLIERRLAACVSVLAPYTSVYRWKNKVEESAEVPLLIKTTAGRYAELESALRVLHPYELPEIIAVPVLHGLPDYLDWVAAETTLPEVSTPSSSS